MSRITHQQGGVITARQCHELGATDSDLRRLLAGGEWRRVRRGVYADSRAGYPARCARRRMVVARFHRAFARGRRTA